MKKRLLLGAGVLLGAALFLAAGAALFVKLYFPPEKIRALVVAEAEKALHRKVELKSVSFGLVRGLTVEGVRVSERPDFSKGEFAKADSFSFRFAWMPLLQKKFVAHELRLEGVKATIRKDKKGTLNIADLTEVKAGKDKGTSPAGEGAAGAMALQVDAIVLKNAALRYVDEGGKTDTTVSIPLASVKDFSLDGDFPFTVQVALDQKSGKEHLKAVFMAKGLLDLAGGEPKKMRLALQEFSLASDPYTMTGEVALSNLNAPSGKGSVRIAAFDYGDFKVPAASLAWSLAMDKKKIKLSGLRLDLAGMTVEGKVEIPDTSARDLRISLEAASNSFDIAPLAAIAPQSRGRKLAGKASFGLSVTAAGDTLEIKKAQVAFGDLRARASGTVSNVDGKDPGLKLALETDSIPFTSFASFLPELTNLRGQARLTAAVGGTSAKPKVAGTLTLEDAGFEYLKQKLERFAGAVRFSETSLEIPKLTGRVNGGDLELKFAASDPAAPTVTMQGTLSVLDAGALEALMSQTPGDTSDTAQGRTPEKTPPYTGPVLKTSGHFRIGKITHPNFSSEKASLEWSLTGVTPEFKQMDGTAKLRVANGHAVKLLTLAKSKGGMAKAIAQPLIVLDKARGKIPGVSIPPMEDIPFERIEGDYTFRSGVMDMQPSLFDGPTLRAETRGKVDLPASRQDLRTEMRVENIGNVALLISGTMDDPKIEPDLTKVKAKAKEEAVKVLEKQGKELLKKFLKR